LKAASLRRTSKRPEPTALATRTFIKLESQTGATGRPFSRKSYAPVTQHNQSNLDRTATSNLDQPKRERREQRNNVMWSTSCPISSSVSSSDYLREHARRLLRAAREGDTSAALPVLRRLHAAQITHEERLADLNASREELQLKHLLAMLAIELGYANWDACKHDIDTQPQARIDRYRLDAGAFNDFEKNWFANETEAREWQRENGGYIVRYGEQAVAILSKAA
jgi:hypothetical protein